MQALEPDNNALNIDAAYSLNRLGHVPEPLWDSVSSFCEMGILPTLLVNVHRVPSAVPGT